MWRSISARPDLVPQRGEVRAQLADGVAMTWRCCGGDVAMTWRAISGRPDLVPQHGEVRAQLADDVAITWHDMVVTWRWRGNDGAGSIWPARPGPAAR
jgi:hypothetical protein